MQIRKARREDLAAVRDLLVATWHDTYDHIYGLDNVSELNRRWHAPTVLARGLQAPGSCFLVAEAADGTLMATAFAERRGAVIHLRRLYVAPEFQRQGLGRALLEAVTAAFPGATWMRLEVEPANAGAAAFYFAQGFRFTGQAVAGDARARVPVQVMERGLPASDASRTTTRP